MKLMKYIENVVTLCIILKWTNDFLPQKLKINI